MEGAAKTQAFENFAFVIKCKFLRGNCTSKNSEFKAFVSCSSVFLQFINHKLRRKFLLYPKK